eukprot:GGOE01058114.1.p1 GENE.GGOE01058114.1~~GGOE01058114.1.p1  ORF type:complete len:471 (+),score=104.62 GGOE01058114.1:69-1415(+)
MAGVLSLWQALCNTVVCTRDAVSWVASFGPFHFLHLLVKPYNPGPDRDDNVGPIAWHPQLLMLASVSPAGHIALYDHRLGQWAPYTLHHQFHRNVCVLTWKPFSQSVLAVGCRGGVCLWETRKSLQELMGHPGAATAAETGDAAQASGAVFYSKAPGVMMFVPHPDRATCDAVAFSPSGHRLAIGSRDSCRVLIHDTSLPATLPEATVRCLVTASGGTHILSWSPSGRYLLVGNPTATSLSVYDTEKWEATPFTVRRPIRHAQFGLNDVVCYVLENSLDIEFLKVQRDSRADTTVSCVRYGTFSLPRPERGLVTSPASVPPVDQLLWDSTSQALVTVVCDEVRLWSAQEADTPFAEMQVRPWPQGSATVSRLGDLPGALADGDAVTVNDIRPAHVALSCHQPKAGNVSLLAIKAADGEVLLHPLRFIPSTAWAKGAVTPVVRWTMGGK